MANPNHVEGLMETLDEFKKLAAETKKASMSSVAVGYSAPHALYVHENNINIKYHMKLKGKPRGGKRPGAFWNAKVGEGRNQFLTGVLQEKKAELVTWLAKAYRASGSWKFAFLAAGTHLLALSQKAVPYETGELHNSGFVRLEK